MTNLPTEKQFTFLNDLRDLVYQDAKDKGWHTSEPKFGDFIANLHGEVSELWESWRRGTLYELCDKAQKMKEHNIAPLTCIEEELADICLRVCDMAAVFKVDLAKAVLTKLLFNRTRPFRN